MTLRSTKQLPSARSLELSGPARPPQVKPSPARAPESSAAASLKQATPSLTRSLEPSAAARLKLATTPARLPLTAARDGFESKPLKSGPTLSGNALNVAASPQLKTLGEVTGGTPELASARLASLGSDGIRGNSLLAQARLASLGGEGILGNSALTAAKLASLTGKELLASSALLDGGVHALGNEAAARTEAAEAAEELLTQQFLEAQGLEQAFGEEEVQEALGPDSPLTPEQKEEYVALLVQEHPELLSQSSEIPYANTTAVYGPETQKLIADTIASAHESGAISDADLQEAAATFENPTEFAALLAFGDDTGEVGGPLDVVGQYYQEQAGSTDDAEAASRYRVATALAFTSSEALINERLPTEEARVKAFSTVALQIDEQFNEGLYPNAQAINAAIQDQFAENATRLFGLKGDEIAKNLSSTTDSPFSSGTPKGTDILTQFFAGTLLSPRAEELQVDGRPANEVLTQGFEAAYNYLWNEAVNAELDSGTQSQAFQKVGVFLGTVGTAAEFAERQDLEPDQESKALQFAAKILADAIPTPPGVQPILEQWLTGLVDDPGKVEGGYEDFAEQYIEMFKAHAYAYENEYKNSDAGVNVEVGINQTVDEYHEDLDG
jgi:hypothetical protein